MDARDADPLWYKDALIYQVHVRSFFDANDDGIGDFPGLTSRLDYIADLGVTAVWLMPFYPSPLKDDGYDIADYRDIHPDYGTLDDFRVFLGEAQRRGLRVIIELVINHTSDRHPWFQASRSAPSGSPERAFYVWSDTDQPYRDARVIFRDTEKSNWSWDAEAGQSYWHRFAHHLPDLNFDNPIVVEAIVDVIRFWLDLGVDGMRLDAIPFLVEREGTSCENLPETHAVLRRFRAALDERHRDRIFLAEANQWPDDVRPYFGDGDECHMAFHFPVMPRMFMAIRREDRTPIVEIMERTPEIPENCQWALFLRNHDELTLEMVTDEERDYMVREYAADPRARLNLGIRRRLAPLLDHSRRRLELLTSLLLSFPGTPVLYYGDELGMGDNIYLGDRHGVRTPMQWSADRNGGFSRADFARLFSPPVMDPVGGYLAVNVEAQRRDPSSLLNWTRRMLGLRRRYPAFGRGTIEFLKAPNIKVLTYIRRYRDEAILCLANLSRFVQPLELDLSEFAGSTPVEVFGRTDFPRIGEGAYFLSLGPHSFYWFELRPAVDPWALEFNSVTGALPAELPSIASDGGLESIVRGKTRRLVQTEVLPAFFNRQRWFAGKARTIRSVRILDATRAGELPRGAMIWIVEVAYVSHASEQYLVPLTLVAGPEGEALRERAPRSILAAVSGEQGDRLLVDATVVEEVAAWLLDAVAGRRELRTASGRLSASRTSAFVQERGDPATPLAPSWIGGEQSNSSIRFGDRLILKLFRRLESGENPESEIGRFLTERTTFDRVPRTTGTIDYRRPDLPSVTVGILQNLVSYQAIGWEHALAEVELFYEAIVQRHGSGPESPPLGVVALSDLEPPKEAKETVGAYLAAAETLGRRTAELHLAMASRDDDPAFAPEDLDQPRLGRVIEEARTQMAASLDLLQSRLTSLDLSTAEQAAALLEARAGLQDQLSGTAQLRGPALAVRCHGDYHLGQVLWSMNDYYILDFEGEPTKSLAARRRKHSPIKDVVGMLRSYDYAAHAGLFRLAADRPAEFGRLLPSARWWSTWTGAAFLRAYRQSIGDSRLLPASTLDLEWLVRLYTLDKALYELAYELGHRPDWVRIPLLAVNAAAGLPEIPLIREGSTGGD